MILNLLLSGFAVNLKLGALAILLGMAFGLVLTIGRVYGGTLISQVIASYIDLIRGLPVVVILFVLYFIVGEIITLSTYMCVIIALIVRSSAYQSMAFTGAFQSVSSGQMMAGEALGFTRLEAIRNVILPQALRFALPAWSNEVIATFKDTPLAFLLGVVELTKYAEAMAIVTRNPLLCYGLAAILFYITITALSKTLTFIEHKTRIPGFGGGST